jgi:hypothetical protein
MLPKKIFAFWHSGRSNAPQVVQRCFDEWEAYNPSHRLEVYDFDTALAELSDRPPWIAELPVQAFADMLRIQLLRRYGGVWVDATLLPSAPLDHWVPSVLEATGFFAFSQTGAFRRLDNWFLAAEPETPMIRRLDDAIRSYWDRPRKLSQETRHTHQSARLRRGWRRWLSDPRRVIWNSRYASDPVRPFREERRSERWYPYFWFHHLTHFLAENDPAFRNDLDRMPFWPMSMALLVQDAVVRRCYDDDMVARAMPMFFTASPVHKLDWRHDWPECLFDRPSTVACGYRELIATA